MRETMKKPFPSKIAKEKIEVLNALDNRGMFAAYPIHIERENLKFNKKMRADAKALAAAVLQLSVEPRGGTKHVKLNPKSPYS